MIKSIYHVIGVMSGTSLDGVDLAHIRFEKTDSSWQFEIFQTETIAYTETWAKRLKHGINVNNFELTILNHDYTELLANIIQNFIDKHQIKNLDAVCSHGHTIKHEPHKSYTLQIGNLPVLAKILNQKVVCDFRAQDVALGGQGAPLVPIGDEMLFPHFTFCLNLGGFSNVSFHQNGQRIAFDICPINTVLNHLANRMDLPYDKGGEWAKTGLIQHDLLNDLNQLPFYQKQPPKSLGVEFLHDEFYHILSKYHLKTVDLMRTCVAHFTDQLSKVLNQPNASVLCTGGGVYHTFLMNELQQKLPQTKLIIPDNKLIEFKEALIFAFLGVLKLRNDINVLKSVTGASKDHSSGVIFI